MFVFAVSVVCVRKMVAQLNECENDMIRVQGVVTMPMTMMSDVVKHTVTKCSKDFDYIS